MELSCFEMLSGSAKKTAIMFKTGALSGGKGGHYMGVRVREKIPGSGVWWVFVSHNRRRKSRKIGTEKNARKFAEMLQAKIILGKEIAEEKPILPTIGMFYERFKKTYLKTAVRESTAGSYEGNFQNHILPALGPLRLDEVTRSKIKEFVASLVSREVIRFSKANRRTALLALKGQLPDLARLQGFLIKAELWVKQRGFITDPTLETSLEAMIKNDFPELPDSNREAMKNTILAGLEKRKMARPSIRIILAELCAMFNSAIEDGLIMENPARRLSRFYKQAPIMHEEIQPLTHAEVPIFLETTVKYAPDCYPLFLCAIHTGLRSGELAGLKWEDVDFNSKFLIIRKNIVRGKVHKTKTDQIRRVDMSDALIAELMSLRRRRKEDYLTKGKNEIPEWVFCNQEGNPADMHNIKNRHFAKCLAKAGLRRIRFHDLRHSFASLLLQDGQSLKYVSDQLGHSSIKMTADIYGHLVPGANRQAVNRLPTRITAPQMAEAQNA
jgi:integrase